MILPRLIIADDFVSGKMPASLLIVRAMKNRQIPVNLFLYGRSAEDIRMTSLLMDDTPAYCLDLYTMSNARMLKTLFRRCSSPDALNIISMPLGTVIDEKTFQVNPECPELARTLNCNVIPIMSPQSLPNTIVASLACMAADAFKETAPGKVRGMIFSAVKSTRDFQHLEREFLRRTPLLTLGFIPTPAFCSMPSMDVMSGRGALASIIPLKSAAIQLAGLNRQIEWTIIESLAALDAEWQEPEPVSYQRKSLNIAVIGQNMSVEGDSNLEVFRLMGCNVMKCDVLKDGVPQGSDVIYFPNTVNEPYIEQLLASEQFRAGMSKNIMAKTLILATGASSMLFGDTYVTSSLNQIQALGVFPYTGNTTAAPAQRRRGPRKIEMRAIQDTPFMKNGEKIRGMTTEGFSISNPGNLAAPCLAYREMQSTVESGLSGWNSGYCFATDLKLDMWSALDVISHWLSLRKR